MDYIIPETLGSSNKKKIIKQKLKYVILGDKVLHYGNRFNNFHH